MVNPANPTHAQVRRRLRELWLIPTGETPLYCDRAELDGEWISFRVARNATLAAGHHCELCSNRPGESTPPGLGVAFNRGAVLKRVRPIEDGDGPALLVEARLDRRGPCA